MTRRKRFPEGSTNLDLATTPGDVLDSTSAAALLSVEYPLIDSTLIMALLSDYSPLLASHLDEIRDQLGVLEATLIPDVQVDGDDVGPIDEVHSDLDDESEKIVLDIDKLAINDPPPYSNLAIPSASSKTRRSSTSGSRTSHTTSPTSAADSEGGFEEDISMLKSLFPAMKEEELRKVLLAESGVPAAIDHLLSIELIRDVEQEGRWPDEKQLEDEETPFTEVSRPIAQPEPVRPVLVKTLAKSKKKSTKTIPLVDTLQRRSTPSGSRPSSRPVSRGPSRPSSRTASPSRAPGPSTNAWGTVSSLAAFLSDVLPSQPTTYFLAHLHSPKHHSAYTAVRAALAEIPPSKRPSDDTSRAILEDVYGLALENDSSQRVNEDLIICVRAAGDDVAAVMDLMDLLAEISEWPSDDLDRYDAVNEQYYASHFPNKESSLRVAVTNGQLQGSIEPAHPTQEVSQPVAPEKSSDYGRLNAPPKKEEVVKQQITIGANTILSEPIQKFVPGAQPSPSSFASPTAFDTFGSPSNFAISSPRSKSKERQIHPQNWRTVSNRGKAPTHAANIPAYARGLPNRPGPGLLHRKSSGPSASQVDQYLSHAAAERQKREDAIRLAGRHYRGNLAGGKAVNGAVAGHYALQAREAAERARSWEMKAARTVVSDQLDQSRHTIDLHHLTIVEATTVALESAATWYEREKIRSFGGNAEQSRAKAVGFTPARGLVIVVGVGRHSAGHKGVLGPAVANALEGGGWKVDRGANGRGYLVVRGRK